MRKTLLLPGRRYLPEMKGMGLDLQISPEELESKPGHAYTVLCFDDHRLVGWGAYVEVEPGVWRHEGMVSLPGKHTTIDVVLTMAELGDIIESPPSHFNKKSRAMWDRWHELGIAKDGRIKQGTRYRRGDDNL